MRLRIWSGCLLIFMSISCLYLIGFLVWQYDLLVDPHQIDPKYLLIDPEDYSQVDFIFSLSETTPICKHVECEYWNFMASYMADPLGTLGVQNQQFRFLSHPPGFQVELPFITRITNLANIYKSTFRKKAKVLLTHQIFKPTVNSAMTVLYIHSTADFIRAHALHPSAKRYVLFSTEKADLHFPIALTDLGNVDFPSQLEKKYLSNLLPSIHDYILHILEDKDAISIVGSVLPYLLAQLKIAGDYHILEVKEHSPMIKGEDGSPKTITMLEITFCSLQDMTPRGILYVSSRLTNIDITTPLIDNIMRDAPYITLVGDSPGYFELHKHIFFSPHDEFCPEAAQRPITAGAENVMNFVQHIMGHSQVIIQNDHAIPFHWFNDPAISVGEWNSIYFGHPGPLVSSYISFSDWDVIKNNQTNEYPVPFQMDSRSRYTCQIQANENTFQPQGIWFSSGVACADTECRCPLPFVDCSLTNFKNSNFLMVLAKK